MPALDGVKPADGLYVPLPWTDAVPTVVPPVVQVVGAVVCGPKTLNVIVPPAPLDAPVSWELIEPAAIAVLVAPLAGAATVVAVLAGLTWVLVCGLLGVACTFPALSVATV